MRSWAWLALPALLAVWRPTAGAQPPPAGPGEIEGVYKVTGADYEGTIAIRKLGDGYSLTWTIGAVVHRGVGLRTGNLLAADWSQGVVIYEIQANRRLVGQYAGRDGKVLPETLTFLRALPALPPPRAWQVGDRALVHWSKNEFWYPATVQKKDGDKYFIVFDDGDEEWTTADRMTAEDLRVGDRVFGNWKKGGTYYPGKITKREGHNIHISYDDGDQEDTTIGVVRVLRPREE